MLLRIPSEHHECAKLWMKFILEHCDFPNLTLLRDQIRDAEFLDFCECGCNSFAVRVDERAKPLASPAEHRSPIFEADFYLIDQERTIEIMLFAGKSGNLEYVEVDHCANSYPVPAIVDIKLPAFHTYTYPRLLK